ncbi:hypothetical protein CTI12_AA469830 [Artemisia annua]|uniref:Uncharacterized protein n=1 Tax=Artemisia annua TaxID=35608 RepID=A0A2U1LPD1_ARTAN|nr:hypothetical protein CTI12_AA469830 [Artemisia annua]
MGQKYGANGGNFERRNFMMQRKEYRKKNDRNEEKNGRAEKQQVIDGQNDNQRGNNEKNKWKVREEDVEALRRSANKYAVLESHEEEERQEVNLLKDRQIVDMYLNKKEKPTKEVLSNWSKDMANYFNTQWEIDRIKEKEDSLIEIEEVMENNSETGNMLVEDEIQGRDKTVLNYKGALLFTGF